jgi:hypothetical protein
LVLIRIFGGGTRSRTEIHGFAIRCIANLPFRHSAKYLILISSKKKLERETRFASGRRSDRTPWGRNLTNREDFAFTSKL